MKIEIKLKDVSYCDGCPCICSTDLGDGLWCQVDGGMCEEFSHVKIIRPKECIEKYGE